MMITFRDLRNTARLHSEGGLPLLGCPSAAVLLILGAAELTIPLRLLAAVRAHADHTLLSHQKLASVPIANHNNLKKTTKVHRRCSGSALCHNCSWAVKTGPKKSANVNVSMGLGCFEC